MPVYTIRSLRSMFVLGSTRAKSAEEAEAQWAEQARSNAGARPEVIATSLTPDRERRLEVLFRSFEVTPSGVKFTEPLANR